MSINQLVRSHTQHIVLLALRLLFASRAFPSREALPWHVYFFSIIRWRRLERPQPPPQSRRLPPSRERAETKGTKPPRSEPAGPARPCPPRRSVALRPPLPGQPRVSRALARGRPVELGRRRGALTPIPGGGVLTWRWGEVGGGEGWSSGRSCGRRSGSQSGLRERASERRARVAAAALELATAEPRRWRWRWRRRQTRLLAGGSAPLALKAPLAFTRGLPALQASSTPARLALPRLAGGEEENSPALSPSRGDVTEPQDRDFLRLVCPARLPKDGVREGRASGQRCSVQD